MNVLLSPQPQPPSFFPHQHETNRRSPSRATVCDPELWTRLPPAKLRMSPFHTSMASNRKRKAEDDGDEMSVSPLNSPATQSRQLAPRPSKKVRANELAGRPLSLPRLLETLDITQLRTVLQTICERQPEIGEEVVKSAPKPSVDCALQVLKEYQDKLRDAFPYGDSSSDYTYYRVKQQLIALIDALVDFTHQFLPPNETSANLSLQYLDGATKVAHSLPDWESQSHRHHKENVYYEISQAWALVINEASKKGAGFVLHSGGWDQKLAKHNQQSGGRLGAAISSMAANVGWVGGSSGSSTSNTPGNQSSILDHLMAGNYGAPVPVGRW
ncbi:Tethering factor for nuclear proteasome sts1 [Daldinia eschscholtzii]|uniref:Tethering factor for nuclear proteasome STS1 n=1 Tax=Daldinia eschscholtzii TaxID=292717 RepID=A0AAX6MDA1_9PEZI